MSCPSIFSGVRALVPGAILMCLSGGIAVQAQETGLWGTLKDAETLQPVTGHVSIVHGSGTDLRFYDVRCNSMGLFEMMNLPPGEKTLVARADGYGFAWKKIILKHGMEFGGISFVLEQMAGLRGQALDEMGQPVANATVQLAYKNLPPTIFDYMTGWVETDSTGVFRIRNVTPNRDFYVEVSHPDFAARLSAVRFRAQPGEMLQIPSITLTRGTTVRGQALDADGQPLSDVEIRLIPNQLGERLPADYRGLITAGVEHRATRTDEAGRFAIGGVPDGRFLLLARHIQFRPYHRFVAIDQTLATTVRLEVQLRSRPRR